jgi:hypothetical protein
VACSRPMSIELVPLCTAHISLRDPIILPDTPAGTRIIVEVAEATLEGERLRAKQLGVAAADWAVLGSDMTLTLDVRGLFETHDGATVFTSYRGRSDLSGGPGSAPIYATPLYDTGDARYAWLNKVQAIAKGALDGSSLTYEIYEAR